MKLSYQLRRWGFLPLMVAVAVTAFGLACGSSEAPAPAAAAATARPAEAAAPAAKAAAAAKAAPAAKAAAAATARPAEKGMAAEEAAPAATARPAEKAAEAMAPEAMEEDVEVVMAVRRVAAVIGLPTIGPYAGTPTHGGGVEEYFYHFENGDPMTPELVESWDIDPAGTRVSMTMRQHPDGGGIPFNPPAGFEDMDFGVSDADSVVRYFNESNATTNPDTTYGNSGDLAAIFLEAKKVDDWTVEIGLVSPVYFCLPISQFGCLSAARGLYYLAHADSMGVEWAREHHVATGPFVQGHCVPGDRCTTEALGDHWRVVPSIDKFTQVQVAENNTRIAMLRNGEADLAALDFKLVPGVVQEGYRFLETMPGGFVGQSILFPGLLWEHSHARTGEPLEPWACGDQRSSAAIDNACGSGPNEGSYTQDYPWIGNPWGTEDAPCTDGDGPGLERCGNAPYADTDNPPGISDMEQARLVRLALSIAMDRNEINNVFLDGKGTPIYSEYMGPEYPGWDPDRTTGCWDWLGNRIDCPAEAAGTPFENGVPWEIPNGNLPMADLMLSVAGYPLVDGKRQGIENLTLQAYVAEIGEVSLEVADYITSQWEQLGIEIEQLIEDYGGVISQRMRRRVQLLPVFKNGDVHSNVYPLDWPLPTVDTSSSRPGWGVGFESQPGGKWLFEILAEQDKAAREQAHLKWVDWSMYWVQYAGVVQVPKGVVAGPRIASWGGRQQHYSNISSNPEFIVLR
jgi:ABC-type transport system substrate-binding protein